MAVQDVLEHVRPSHQPLLTIQCGGGFSNHLATNKDQDCREPVVKKAEKVHDSCQEEVQCGSPRMAKTFDEDNKPKIVGILINNRRLLARYQPQRGRQCSTTMRTRKSGVVTIFQLLQQRSGPRRLAVTGRNFLENFKRKLSSDVHLT